MIGDAYYCVCGHEESTRADHAQRMLGLAKDMLKVVQNMRLPGGASAGASGGGGGAGGSGGGGSGGDRPVRVRIGMDSGPAYAGVIGAKCPRYTFFGRAPQP